MRRRMTGLSVTLFIFSFVITSFLIAAFILYIKFIPVPNLGLPGYLANLNDNFLISSIEKGSAAIPINTINWFIAKDQIENMYLSEMINDLTYSHPLMRRETSFWYKLNF